MTNSWKFTQKKILDDDFRYRFQYNCVYVALGIISFVMTIVNIVSKQSFITVVTAIFSLFCFASFLINFKFKPERKIMAVPFVLLINLIYIYFIISGKPDGFSVLWVCFLPTCGLLLFGRKAGTVFSAFMLVLLFFFFWSAPGQSLLEYNYSATFRMRFPFLFAAFYFVSLLLETVRVNTHRALQDMAEKYSLLSSHDVLTGIQNRLGFQDALEKSGEKKSFLIIDLDHFKNINDSYGHMNGDVILKQVAQRLKNELDSKGNVCRWGGEEFAVFFSPALSENELKNTAEEIRKIIADKPFVINGMDVCLTASIGGADDLSDADKGLYTAKEKGSNCVCIIPENK